ncbi:hypothetical protein C8J56DRAFT_970150 [Mycena floridula]|nr:hypothetical protein C8J56DRAFT_970150 [Mycena floridula]
MKSFIPPPGACIVFELDPEATLELHCDVVDKAAVEEVRKLRFKKYVGFTVKIIDDPPRRARNYNRVSICPVNWAMDNDSTKLRDLASKHPALRSIFVRVSTVPRHYGLALKAKDDGSVPRVGVNGPLLEGKKTLKEQEDWDDGKSSPVFGNLLVAQDTPEDDLEFTPIVRVSSEYMSDIARDVTELYEEHMALQRIVDAAKQRRREASDITTDCFDPQPNPFSLLAKVGGNFGDRKAKMRSESTLCDVNEKTSKERKIWKRLKSQLKPRVSVPSTEKGGTSSWATTFFPSEGPSMLVNVV